MNVFERYAPFIQDYIYRSGWQSLRAVQNAAGDAIFHTDENVLLTVPDPDAAGRNPVSDGGGVVYRAAQGADQRPVRTSERAL